MPPKKTAAKSTAKRSMSVEHKAAIAEGRVQSKAVSSYLDALETNRPKRGRQRTEATITKRLGTIDDELRTADGITRLNLRQEKRDLEAELATKESKVDVSALESEFVAHAAAYGSRKGISYGVWRDSGVSPAVLKQAGITRSA